MRSAAVWLLAALLVACTTPAASSAVTDDRSERTIMLAGESWTVLVAPPDGMRGRTGFGRADGMLFDLGEVVEPTAVVFVMDGVAVPLDIAWFDGDGDLIGTATMPVCPAMPCPLHQAPGPYRWAIEAPVGAFTPFELGDPLDLDP